MPAPPNAKHELFAQALASGKTATEAYVAAGYKANRGNAATLKQDQSISNRVVEILAERENIHAQATAEAIEKAGLTKEWIIGRLIENVDRAMQSEPVKDSKGVPTGEYTYQGNVANKALELLGKELGMFVDRSINQNLNAEYVISAEPIEDIAQWEAEHTIN
jgi:phage terminase small subunit